jgi:hypothetical protein
MVAAFFRAEEVSKMKALKSNPFVSTYANESWQSNARENKITSIPARVAGDEALERQKLEERLGEVQRNARCVWRAVRLMLFLTAFAVVGLGHSTVLMPDWPQTMRQFLMYLPIKAHCVLGLASLGCAFVFSGLGIRYRKELSWLGVECRRLADEVTGTADVRVIPLTGESALEQAASMKEAA